MQLGVGWDIPTELQHEQSRTDIYHKQGQWYRLTIAFETVLYLIRVCFPRLLYANIKLRSARVYMCMYMHVDKQESQQHQPDILHPYTSKRSAMPVSQVTGRIRTKRVSVGLGSIVLATSVGLVLPWKTCDRGGERESYWRNMLSWNVGRKFVWDLGAE